MVHALCIHNTSFVYAWCDNLLGIIDYIDQYIEHTDIERVQQASQMRTFLL